MKESTSNPAYTRLWLALQATPGLGNAKALKIVAHCGIEQLFQLSILALQPFNLNPIQVNSILHPDWRAIDATIAWASENKCAIICYGDETYPAILREIASPPLVLFAQGNLALLAQPQIAVIGSRNATYYGRDKATEFAQQLSQVGLVITSGLALGVDTCAHQGALQGSGETIAVLGSGLGNIYPKRNLGLAQKIKEQGLLLSEFLPKTPPLAKNFPRRNRIISGLSLGTLVIEASIKSGSLITAKYALEQNREVFALPGSVDNVQACGCHWLIKQGAKLVTELADIIDELQLIVSPPPVQLALLEEKNTGNTLPFPRLLDSVGFEATSIDLVVERSGEPVQQVQSQLLELELEGWIAQVPEGYVRLRRD
ncbi:DNA-processing protein DprA [Motilimonas sp. E26]|uniref:DNA-processing protein DprA n=1 Tax=Motilimonas TaxID=1914248 RepID=UPI001E2FDFFF|nr:DNA-processing protein DprA [Motilimonas sp. E26]MCE0556571.1 DNA-processing protein DprA [Motilimonas sp. E26]